MSNANCGFSFVNVLTACTTCTISINTQICRIDFYVYFFCFRQNCYGNSGSMHATLGFSFRNTLYAMHATFKFHTAKYAVTIYLEHNFFKTAQFSGVRVKNFYTPATSFCITQVHSKEYACEKCSFVATCTTTNFHDNVFIIVGVRGEQQNSQAFFVSSNLRFKFFQLFFRHFCKLFVITCKKNFFCFFFSTNHFTILTENSYDISKFSMSFSAFLPFSLVGNNIRVTDACF